MQLMRQTSRTPSLRTARSATAICAKPRVLFPSSIPRLHRNKLSNTAIFAAEADVPGSTEEEEEDFVLSPMDRAKLVLSQEEPDKIALEAALADLVAEMVRMQESVAAADSRAVSMEEASFNAKDQLLRLTADFENFRRRTADEKAALKDSVRGAVVQDLLPVIDNFELARTNVKAETDGEIKINQSYQGLYKQFVEFLRTMGVEAIPTQGEIFDPELHEAIVSETDNSVPEDTIIQEFRKGFRLNDKLLRPSMVKAPSTSWHTPTVG
eukprot:gene24007-9580_t